MIRRPPRSTLSSSSAASDVYKRQNTGSIYIADSGNATIRRIQVSNGGVTTIAGQPGTSSVTFQDPSSVAVDSSGNIYVADMMNNAIRQIASSGAITTLAGNV